jgi:hypothetical protein
MRLPKTLPLGLFAAQKTEVFWLRKFNLKVSRQYENQATNSFRS